jgi:hypothetical protein
MNWIGKTLRLDEAEIESYILATVSLRPRNSRVHKDRKGRENTIEFEYSSGKDSCSVCVELRGKILGGQIERWVSVHGRRRWFRGNPLFELIVTSLKENEAITDL